MEYALLGIAHTIRINCKKIPEIPKRDWIATVDILGRQKITQIFVYIYMSIQK